jgi:uncharacterized membrane protein
VSATAAARFDRLDALRGVAIVWMAVFHFAFDLNHFGLLEPRQDFYARPVVDHAAHLHRQPVPASAPAWARRWRCTRAGLAALLARWAQVAGCAVLVSVGSALMFPRSWISFGVLHGIAVMLILARCWRPCARAVAAGCAGAGAAALVQHPFFDTPAGANWVGLVTRKPVTEDYVPVLPWLGVMLWGLAAGQWLLAHRRGLLAGRVPAAAAAAGLLGRWSLSFYMLHQPVFIGAILAGRKLGWW